MRSRPARLASTALLVAGCLAGLAACGDDDEGGGDEKLAAACRSDVQVGQAFERFFQSTPALQREGPPRKQDIPQIRSSFDRIVAGPLAQFERNVPEEIADDSRFAIREARKVRNGDPSGVMSPRFEQATGRMDAYFFDNCEGQKGEVEAVDFGYKDLKDTYEPGITRFKMDNTGKELHEMIVLRRKPGVRETFDQIIELPEEQGRAKVDVLGGPDPQDPGKASYGAVNLTPGRYLAVCFIPVGSTPGKEGKGPPHFARGMKQEFSVE